MKIGREKGKTVKLKGRTEKKREERGKKKKIGM